MLKESYGNAAEFQHGGGQLVDGVHRQLVGIPGQVDGQRLGGGLLLFRLHPGKESYGNAFAPWLFANYEDVYVIDYRHYEKSVTSFVMENGIDTVIFINNSFP